LRHAITSLREAIALDPANPQPYLPFVQCLAPPGRLQLLIRWAYLSPHDPQPLIRLSHSYRELGRPIDAIPAAINAIQRKPDLADGQMALGVAHHAKGDLASACHAFAAALVLMPDHFSSTINLALALFEYLGPEQALSAVDYALKSPDPEMRPGPKACICWPWVHSKKAGDLYEGRLNRPGIIRPDIAAKPQWRGEAFAGSLYCCRPNRVRATACNSFAFMMRSRRAAVR